MTKVTSIVVACVGTALAASLGFASKGHLTPINTSDISAGYSRVEVETKGNSVSFSTDDGTSYSAGVKEYFEPTEAGPSHDEDTPPDTGNEDKDKEDEVVEEEELEEFEEEVEESSTVTKVDQAQSVLGVIAVVAILGIAGLLAVVFFKGAKKRKAAAAK